MSIINILLILNTISQLYIEATIVMIYITAIHMVYSNTYTHTYTNKHTHKQTQTNTHTHSHVVSKL